MPPLTEEDKLELTFSESDVVALCTVVGVTDTLVYCSQVGGFVHGDFITVRPIQYFKGNRDSVDLRVSVQSASDYWYNRDVRGKNAIVFARRRRMPPGISLCGAPWALNEGPDRAAVLSLDSDSQRVTQRMDSTIWRQSLAGLTARSDVVALCTKLHGIETAEIDEHERPVWSTRIQKLFKEPRQSDLRVRDEIWLLNGHNPDTSLVFLKTMGEAFEVIGFQAGAMKVSRDSVVTLERSLADVGDEISRAVGKQGQAH